MILLLLSSLPTVPTFALEALARVDWVDTSMIILDSDDDQKKQALVASHLLSEYDGTIAGEYYNAMRKMFYHVACPFCGVSDRLHR